MLHCPRVVVAHHGAWGLQSSGDHASPFRRGDAAHGGLLEPLVQGHRAAALKATCAGHAF